jgi:uncharacterized lipoprotein YehR (DUF1307 family)
MQTIGIGEIQKNTSILTNLTEALEIVDKRKKESVAIVYPIQKNSLISKLSGKYKDRVSQVADLTLAKEEAMLKAFGDKHGLSD